MYMLAERIGRILTELKTYSRRNGCGISSITFVKGNYRYEEAENLDASVWVPFNKDDRWGGINQHFLFTMDYTVPITQEGKELILEISTGREGEWDAINPQFLAYLNGSLVQGLDVNHREIILSKRAAEGDVFKIYLLAFSGMKEGLVSLGCCVSVAEREVEKLYYDLDVPYQVAAQLDKESKQRIDILRILNDGINLIDFRKPYSAAFYESVEAAEQFLEKEFYEVYCGDESVIASCVGHTTSM